MRFFDLLKLSAFIFFLTSCAFAPLASVHTAEPLGKGGNSIETGLSPLPFFQYTRGVSEEVDVGGGFEVQFGLSLFGFAKYSFIHPKNDGWSFAVSGGGGLGISHISSYFLFAGPIASWRNGGFEFFINPRLNNLYLSTYPGDRESRDSEYLHQGNVAYGQLSTGFQYHFNQTFALGLSGTILSFGLKETVETVIPAINLIFNF